MSVLIWRKFVSLVLTLLGASILVCVLLRIAGSDPATILLGEDATPESVAALREQLGLNIPLWRQYFDWIIGMVRLDFGVSYISQVEVAPLVWERLAITIPLALYGMAIAIVVAIPTGVLGAVRHRNASGALISSVSQVGIAIPGFWLGIMLASFFAVRLGWFPSGSFTRWEEGVLPALRSLTLPALSIGLVQGAWISRYVRSAVIDVIGEDYIRTARSKGMTKGQALRRHGLRNAALPVVTVIGIQFGLLVSGTVIIESVYYLAGLGRMVVTAVGQRDLILVQSTVMVIVFLVVMVNFFTDVLYGVMDPRTKGRRL